MAPPLNERALNEACRAFAHRALAQGTLVDVSRIEALAQQCVEVAAEGVNAAVEAGRDPNLVVRAVQFLCTCDSLPPNAGTPLKFYEMLSALMELACPTKAVASSNAAFFADIDFGFRNAT